MFLEFLLSLGVLLIVQYFIFNYILYPLYYRISKLSYGQFLTRPVVYLHEFFGHILPGMLTGSQIRDMDFEASEGSVSATIPHNMFGAISIVVMGLGPSLILPLLYILLLVYLSSCSYSLDDLYLLFDDFQHSDVSGYFYSLWNFIRFLPIFNSCDNSSQSFVVGVVAAIISLVFIPGGTSSRKDLMAIFDFAIREFPLFAIVLVSVFGILYIIESMGLSLLGPAAVLLHIILLIYLLGALFSYIFYSYLLSRPRRLLFILLLSLVFSYFLHLISMMSFYEVFVLVSGFDLVIRYLYK